MAALPSEARPGKRKAIAAAAADDSVTEKERKIVVTKGGLCSLDAQTMIRIYGFLHGQVTLAQIHKQSASLFRHNDIWRYWYRKQIKRSSVWGQFGYHAWRRMARAYFRKVGFEKAWVHEIALDDYESWDNDVEHAEGVRRADIDPPVHSNHRRNTHRNELIHSATETNLGYGDGPLSYLDRLIHGEENRINFPRVPPH